MIPKTNLAARQLSAKPQLHRTETLRAIADKTHTVTERIEFLKTEGQRMADLLKNVPDDTDSRLTWLNSQLGQI